MLAPCIEKLLHQSISPRIILLDDMTSIREQIAIGLEIEEVTRKFVRGECSLWEMLELLEMYGEYDIDSWITEIEDNIEYGLQHGTPSIIIAAY